MFSKPGACSGYGNIEIALEEQKKTAGISHSGTAAFTQKPFLAQECTRYILTGN